MEAARVADSHGGASAVLRDAAGIGLAVAKRFLAERWRVVLLDTDGQTLRSVAEEIGRPEVILVLSADVSDPQAAAGNVGTTVEVRPIEGERWVAAIDGGFLSVANNRVSILVEEAEMSGDIDVERARRDLDQARTAGDDDGGGEQAARHAEARIQAVERAS